MAAIAAATERVRLGSAILNVYTRNPVVIAITFVSLDELAPGRIVMGLGAGSPLVLAPQGQPFTRPLYAHARVRGGAASADARRDGELQRQDDQPRRRPHRGPARGRRARSRRRRRRSRIYLGVTGAPALELAGESADGVLLNVCLPTAYVTRARGLIEQGARRAGRDFSAIEIGLMLVVSPDEDSRRGKDRARRFIALYLSLFPNIARETGLPEPNGSSRSGRRSSRRVSRPPRRSSTTRPSTP